MGKLYILVGNIHILVDILVHFGREIVTSENIYTSNCVCGEKVTNMTTNCLLCIAPTAWLDICLVENIAVCSSGREKSAKWCSFGGNLLRRLLGWSAEENLPWEPMIKRERRNESRKLLLLLLNDSREMMTE